jgi:co-chaperonin GroES (HSP10)
MALPVNRPYNEMVAYARTTSIGASPVAIKAAAPMKGSLQRVVVHSEGASTGTITITVAVGATTVGTVVFTGGADVTAVGEFSLVNVNEGDVITFTPSGGGGATIAGNFQAVIRG